jgi:hypothetical protein
VSTVSSYRLAAINLWWDRIRSGLPDQPRLRQAFGDVLGRLSDEALTRFLDYFPLVLSLDGLLGAATRPALLPRWPRELHDRPTILSFSPDSAEQTPHGLLYVVAHEIGHVVLGHVAEGAKPPGAEEEADIAEFIATLGIRKPDKVEELDNYRRLRSIQRSLQLVRAELSINVWHERCERERATARSRIEAALAELGVAIDCLRGPICICSASGVFRQAVLPDGRSLSDHIDTTRPIRTAVRE